VQDPEARLTYIESTNPNLSLLPATTFWGIVNRDSFYNDYYAQYHGLCAPETTTDVQLAIGGPDSSGNCAPGTRRMNPNSLEDALQVCSAYCSEGRYMVRWELDAVMAYLWDLEVKLDDLVLTDAERNEITGSLLNLKASAKAVEAARALLGTKYLRAAGDTFRDLPELTVNGDSSVRVGPYSDGAAYTGDSRRGEQVYARSCAHCHGTAIMPLKGAALIGSVKLYYQALAKGLPAQNAPYMPEFTLQRLSRQQSADIQAYLDSLAR
jgi:mono/diheme cytochrome c family protein